MELRKLAETALLQCECFWLLQEIDEKWRQNDPHARNLLSAIYADRPIKFSNVHPLVRLLTGLSTAFVPICFTLQSTQEELEPIEQGLRSGGYDIRYLEHEREVSVAAPKFLSVFRNALAHLPDFISGRESPNISFEEGILTCRSRDSKIIFCNETGYINFLNDTFRVVRKTAGRLLYEGELSGVPTHLQYH
jgi:hypothetical protein